MYTSVVFRATGKLFALFHTCNFFPLCNILDIWTESTYVSTNYYVISTSQWRNNHLFHLKVWESQKSNIFKIGFNREALKNMTMTNKPKGFRKKNDIACKELQEDGFSWLTPLTLKRLQSKPINFWAFFSSNGPFSLLLATHCSQ